MTTRSTLTAIAGFFDVIHAQAREAVGEKILDGRGPHVGAKPARVRLG